MNQEFAELIDQLSMEVNRLRQEVARLRAENELQSAAPSSHGLFDDIRTQDRHALRHQVIEHIRKIDHLLGEDA